MEERSGAKPWTGAKAADVALARELSELAHAEEELLRHVQEESLEDAFQTAESSFEFACLIRYTSPEIDQRRIMFIIRELFEKLDANMLAFWQPRSKRLMWCVGNNAPSTIFSSYTGTYISLCLKSSRVNSQLLNWRRNPMFSPYATPGVIACMSRPTPAAGIDLLDLDMIPCGSG